MDSPVKELAEKQVELIISEDVPSGKRFNSVYWRQGKFYLKDQWREATVTDIKFITDTLLVVAHRAASKMYLIECIGETFTIIDTLVLDTAKKSWNLKKRLSGSRFFHPDLMSIIGNKVYISEYSNRCCVVEVVDNKLVYCETLELGQNAYHGILCEEQNIYLGSVYHQNITVVDEKTGVVSNLNVALEPKIRIKTIGKEGELFVLAVDKQIGSPKIKGSKNDAWFKLFERQDDRLLLLDSVDFPVSQVDGHIAYKGYHFVVLHDGEKRSGFIIIIKVEDKKLRVVNKIPCGGFPHGIDIRNDKLIYTTYSESSMVMLDVKDLGLSF